MDIDKLMQGVGVIIDDHVMDAVASKNESVPNIISFLEHVKHIPLVKYSNLPDIECIRNLRNVSFLLLDWELTSIRSEAGLSIPGGATLENDNKDEICNFIQNIIDKTCIPIFLFSNESLNDIEEYLKGKRIFVKSKKSRIFLKHKTDLFKDNKCCVFDEIENWYKETPALYLIKEWSNAYILAETTSFLSMLNKSANWPIIMKQCFVDDDVNVDSEMSHFINQLISANMGNLSFDEHIFDCNNPKINSKELKEILECQCLIHINKDDSPETGDLYLKDSIYYINIRPACDCIMRDGTDDVELYLLSCIGTGDAFDPKNGRYIEKSNEAIIGPINGQYRKFGFKKLTIVSYNEWKDKRIGRILHPYVTYLTEKYGLYIHRQGLPRVPKEAVPDKVKLTSETERKEDSKLPDVDNKEKDVGLSLDSKLSQDVVIDDSTKSSVVKKFTQIYQPSAIIMNSEKNPEIDKPELYKTETEIEIQKRKEKGLSLKILGNINLDKF